MYTEFAASYQKSEKSWVAEKRCAMCFILALHSHSFAPSVSVDKIVTEGPSEKSSRTDK